MPSRVGKYELLDLLGRGGMGEVWKARDAELGRVVALKLMQGTDAEDLARFRREAHIVAQLSHPNIAQLYEFSIEPPHLAMQLIEGAPLAPTTPNKIAALRDAARAVHFAHQGGILHRDLKPANIMVDGAGRASVLDFGLAREVKGDATAMTVAGDILGTPGYMAPEQARGDVKSLDARTDVYGLGATLYFLLTGRPPHTGATAFDVISHVLGEDVVRPGGEPDLETICLKALEKEPARRYAGAEEFADDLDRLLRKEPILARPASTLYRIRRRFQRQPVQWSLGALLAVAILGGAGFGLATLIRSNANLKRALAAEEKRKADAERQAKRSAAEARVRSAQAKLAEARTVLYIRGGTLAPFLGQVDGVVAECRAAMRENGEDFPEAWFTIGRAKALYGDLDGAFDAYEKAAALLGVQAYVWAEMARTHLESAYHRSIRPGYTQEERGQIVQAAGAAAEALYDRAEREGWKTEEIERAVARGYRLFAERKGEDLGKMLRLAFARNGRVPWMDDLVYLRAIVGFEENRIEHFTEVLTIRPGHFFALLSRGSERRKQGDMTGALADYDEAIRINPRLAEAHFNRGVVLKERGDPTGALQSYDEAIRIDPAFVEAHYNRANLRRVQGDLEGAIKGYDETLRYRPQHAEARNNRGFVRKMLGDLDGAAEDYDEALRINPKSASAHLNRGLLRRVRGDMEGAKADFDDALKNNATLTEAFVNRAEVRRQFGDMAGAAADFREALRVAPADWPYRSQAEEALREVEAKTGADF